MISWLGPDSKRLFMNGGDIFISHAENIAGSRPVTTLRIWFLAHFLKHCITKTKREGGARTPKRTRTNSQLSWKVHISYSPPPITISYALVQTTLLTTAEREHMTGTSMRDLSLCSARPSFSMTSDTSVYLHDSAVTPHPAN